MKIKYWRILGYIISMFLVGIPLYEILISGMSASLYHLSFVILSLWLLKSTKSLKD
mgnify:CR=1|tara:strand:- start:4679 stop:4846 length:168 start_codon:yes stop_codon:yes gene_type:complete